MKCIEIFTLRLKNNISTGGEYSSVDFAPILLKSFSLLGVLRIKMSSVSQSGTSASTFVQTV